MPLAYKPEHAVDLDTGAVVAAEIHPADEGNTTPLSGTLKTTAANLAKVDRAPSTTETTELVARQRLPLPRGAERPRRRRRGDADRQTAAHGVPALKCRAVADSLKEAGDRLFTFTRLPPRQWRSARTSNAVERLHEEFERRIKTQTVLPSPETAAMLFWALLASGQITMRKVDGWQTLATKPTDAVIDLAA